MDQSNTFNFDHFLFFEWMWQDRYNEDKFSTITTGSRFLRIDHSVEKMGKTWDEWGDITRPNSGEMFRASRLIQLIDSSRSTDLAESYPESVVIGRMDTMHLDTEVIFRTKEKNKNALIRAESNDYSMATIIESNESFNRRSRHFVGDTCIGSQSYILNSRTAVAAVERAKSFVACSSRFRW